MSQKDGRSDNRSLLLCGAVAGPLFIFLVLVQDYTRAGFDPRMQLLSLLSLGEWGWVQIANFVVTGVLNLFYARGLWRMLHPGPAGTWGPLLIGAYGAGLVGVGVFTTDPAKGFPPGSVAAAQPSWHGILHALGGLFVFVALALALVALSRLFVARQERGWALYCRTTAALLFLLFFGGMSNALLTARFLRLATLIGWMAPSIVALKLLNAENVDRPMQGS